MVAYNVPSVQFANLHNSSAATNFNIIVTQPKAESKSETAN